jgi:hypothetical protein
LTTRVVGLALVATVFGGLTAANASAANLVDGSISALGNTCSWTNGKTSANPPTTLTVDRNSINKPGGNLSCTGGVTAVLNNDPSVTFNDGAGTATANSIDATVTSSGQTCRYRATNAVLTRSGTTRNYSGSANAPKVSGSFLCPGSVTLSASASFH